MYKMSKIKNITSTITLNKVKIAYPNVFEKAVFDGKETGNYNAIFLIKKDSSTAKEVKKIINSIIKQVKDSGEVITKEKICFKDGDGKYKEKGYDIFKDCWYIRANNKRKPDVVGRVLEPLTEDSDCIMTGAIVNANIKIKYNSYKAYGNQINAYLLGIQFVEASDYAINPLQSFTALDDSVSDDSDDDLFSDKEDDVTNDLPAIEQVLDSEALDDDQPF